jgi:hypothetical protein
MWLKSLIKEEIKNTLNEAKLYHTFESDVGFDLNKYDFERGIFCIKPWWVGKPGREKYTAFSPNEFGDKVVEIEVADNAKTFKSSDQIEVLQKEFPNPNSPAIKQIIYMYENGAMERWDWHRLDKMIGRFMRRKGYQILHYSDDPMYGDTWAIIDRNVIRGIRFENPDERLRLR